MSSKSITLKEIHILSITPIGQRVPCELWSLLTMSQACPLSRRLDPDELSEQPVWRASKASEGSDEKHDLKMNLEAFANCLSDLQSLYVDKTDGTNASVTPGGNGAGEGKLKSVWSVAFLHSHVDTKQSWYAWKPYNCVHILLPQS